MSATVRPQPWAGKPVEGVAESIPAPRSAGDYWLEYWRSHAAATLDAPSQAQVQRTWQGRPIGEEQFSRIVEWIVDRLVPGPDDVVLDLCCGNGAITQHLAKRSARVVGVDFAEDLLRHVDQARFPNLELHRADMRRCTFPDATFDRILLYACLQYLTPGETVVLMRDVRRWLRPGGRVLIGDVPDSDRMWDFFDSPERRTAYFEQLVSAEPIIGTWFSPDWLAHLGRDCGFTEVEVLRQPPSLPFGHFRFELLLR